MNFDIHYQKGMLNNMAFEVWEERSMVEWTIELGEFEGLVKASGGKS